ncbi:STAS domain-containing protein [Lentzea sp. NPDC042327]|uniref:STAS domain-containing protein n=1 Tax=Lentzea sp. NPDC042327 TaxID=3154801 RepID=UPI0034070F00
MANTFHCPLHVQREVNGLAIVVRADGDLDQDTVETLHNELQIALAMATAPFPVVVDLSRVTFFGSAGINELVVQHRAARAAGVPLRVAAAHRIVLRPITASGVDQLLALYPDVEQALSAGRSARSAG